MALRRLESVVSKSQGATGHSGPGRWSTLMRHRLLVDVARSMAPAVVGFMGLGVPSALVAPAAHAAIPSLKPGDKVYNPITRAVETVTQNIAPASVATDAGWVVLLAQSVGDRFTISGGGTSYTFEVTAVTTAKVGEVTIVTGVTLKNLTTNTSQTVATAERLSSDGSSGSGSNTDPYADAANDYNSRLASARAKIDRLDSEYRWLYNNESSYINDRTRSEARSLQNARDEYARYDLSKKDAYINADSTVQSTARAYAESTRRAETLAGLAREAGF